MTACWFVPAFAAVAACALALQPASADGKAFLKRHGTELLLEGRPFRAVSITKFDAGLQYLKGGEERRKAETAIREMAARGFRVLRFGAIGFYPRDMDLWPAGDEYWKRMDDLVAAARAAGVWLVPTIVWNTYLFPDMAHETVQEMLTERDSRSRQLLDLYVHQLVSRYRDEPTILFWELWNELDLGADLEFMRPYGFSDLNAIDRGAATIRVRRDNYTSEQMIPFMRELAEHVRRLDPNHLIASGYATPRYAAQHLRKARGKGDWTEDSPAETEMFIRDTHPDPIDIISIHFYPKHNNLYYGNRDESSAVSLLAIRKVCDRVGKPVYIGECCGNAYASPAGDVPEFTRSVLKYAVEADYPIVLCWLGSSDAPLVFDLERAGATLKALREAGEKLSARAPVPSGSTPASEEGTR